MTATDQDCFEKTHKTAYSHGLESIYAIETIDLKTVRKIGEKRPEKQQITEKQLENSEDLADLQLEFDFGQKYRSWIKPFFLKEPIWVLGLSQRAHKVLIEQEKFLLSDLVFSDIDALAIEKGVGQGHVDEIARALKSYINHRSLDRAYTLEFDCWIRALSADIERQKLVKFLRFFGLDDLFFLTTAEKMSQKMDQGSPDEWDAEVRQKFLDKGIDQDLTQVAQAFVIPWMVERGGVATTAELHEWLIKCAKNEQLAQKAFDFFSKVFFDGRFFITEALFQVEEGLFAVNEQTGDKYHELLKVIKSYFYSSDAKYSFDFLALAIAKECTAKGIYFSQELIEIILKKSRHFHFRKDASGNSIISSSALF